MINRPALFALLFLAITSCHKHDEPAKCTVGTTPYVYNANGIHLALPLAFTPNGDGKNDVLRVVTTDTLQSYSLTVLDASGNTLFQTTNPRTGWDSFNNGNRMPAGDYTVDIQFKDATGNTVVNRTCVAVLGFGTGGCISSSRYDYVFEDQMDPATATVVQMSGEVFCP